MLNEFLINELSENENFLYVDDNEIKNVNEFYEFDKYLKEETKVDYEIYFNNIVRYKKCFDFIQTNINNKFVTVKNPITNLLIGTDLYFLIAGEKNVLGNNLYSCYYFKENNIILLSDLGTGLGSMNTNCFVLIDFNEKKMFYLYGNILTENIFNKIIAKKSSIDNMSNYDFIKLLNSTKKNISSIYAYHNNLGHQIFNDFTGLYLLSKSSILNETNNIYIGPQDFLNFEEYIKYNYPEINIVKSYNYNINEYDGLICRGIIYKYNHHFVSNKLREHFHENFLNNNLISTSDECKNILSSLKSNNYLKLIIVLRCGSRNMIYQEDTIVELINQLNDKYNGCCQIILSGFTKMNNEEKSNTSEIKVGYFDQNYENIKDLYITLSENIVNRCNNNNVFNINNFNLKETSLIIKECNFGLYQHGSACTIPAWLCHIPGINIGFHDWPRYIHMDKFITQDNKMIYLSDKDVIDFIIEADHVYNYKIIDIKKLAEYIYTSIGNYFKDE
jgi:hypothetical protein